MSLYDQTKKILIITFYFGPDSRVGGKRFTFLSKIFKERYQNLHILTVKEKHIFAKDNSLTGAGTIHRAGMYPPYPIETSNILKRIFRRLWEDFLCFVDPFSGWILPAFFKGLKIIKENKINLIIATGPPFSPMVAACLLSFFHKTKLILDYRDPWSNLDRKYPKGYGQKINKFFERLAVKRASVIVFCSRIMMENFKRSLGKYTNATCHVVTNGFDNRDSIEPLSLGNGHKTMVYAGNFYGERKLEFLAKPLFYMLNKGVISKEKFCFYIFGELQDRDRQVIQKYGLDEIIKQKTWIPYEKIIRNLKGADILFLPSGEDVKYAIPFKFFDYLSVKRPIFALAPPNSAVAELMEEIDCGYLAFYDESESIQQKLEKMIVEDRKYSFYGIEKYNWFEIGKQYNKLIDNIDPLSKRL